MRPNGFYWVMVGEEPEIWWHINGDWYPPGSEDFYAGEPSLEVIAGPLPPPGSEPRPPSREVAAMNKVIWAVEATLAMGETVGFRFTNRSELKEAVTICKRWLAT